MVLMTATLIKGATPRQRNFIGSPDLDDDANSEYTLHVVVRISLETLANLDAISAPAVSWNMMLKKASGQNGFFHLGQIIGENGPSWTMSVFEREGGDIVAIVDATTSGDQDNICDSMTLNQFMAGEL